jgi:muramoyltetrapeptide carboxypeptidase
VSAKFQLPSRLAAGGRIRIVSPAGPVDSERLQQGLDRLRGWGYLVEVAPHALDRDGFLAGSDQDRLSDLTDALLDPAVDAVLCSRGGYGSGRLLDLIDWEKLGNTRCKPFVGFSDLGVFQLNLRDSAGWASYSGLQAANGLGGNPSENALVSFRAALNGRFHWNSSDCLPLISNTSESVRGEFIPICLSMLVSLIGTPHIPDLSGVILCLEDIEEPPYKLDRLFWQLSSSGILDRLAGLILGVFLKGDSDITANALEAVRRYFGDASYPIYTGLPYGHFDDRPTLPFGVDAEISSDGLLRFILG